MLIQKSIAGNKIIYNMADLTIFIDLQMATFYWLNNNYFNCYFNFSY